MSTYHTLKDHVYNYIAEQIASGELKANEKVDENAICSEFSISRTPVREAFIQLAGEGILENVPRKGFVVKEMNIDELSDLYQVIGALDGLAASFAIDNLTDKDFDTMEYIIECIDVAIRLKKFDIYHKEQANFHNVYINKCGNDTLINEISRLEKKIFKISYYSEDIDTTLVRTNGEHRNILNLLRKKDVDGVKKYIAETHWNVSNAKFSLI